LIRLRHIFLILFLSAPFSLAAQEQFYDPAVIREIRIRFKEPNWRYILDSLFRNIGDEGKLRGDVTIDGHLYRNAGIRYKGYSSYNASEIKNPFNIDLDYIIKNQNHLGYVKIKLSNVIQDPSFVREVLSYEISRRYLPSPGANFANIFVNDTLIGLYTNVEAVDEKFIQNHWGTEQNSLIKGEPLKLQYPFGENANLALSHGADSSGYIPYYNLESATGWNDLYELIYRLDQGSGSAERILDTDRSLWMHAFNEVLLNLDSYIGYAQNYYLYRDNNGRFNPIIWDLNMSFGSFRDTDGSTHFQGLTIPQIKTLDPLALMEFAVSPRPLMTRLFANDTLRKSYFAHMRTILDECIRNGWYFNRALELQELIDTDVLKDTNRFYSYDDFHANLTVTVGGTGSMKAYPGLRDLMDSRLAYLDGLAGFSGQPIISEIGHAPEIPVNKEPCWITARIQDSKLAQVGYRFSSGGIFSKVTMTDDGNHHDGMAGDGIFGAGIIPEGHTIQYYIYATNDSAATFSPERAEFEFHTIQPMILPGDIVLNEFKAGTGEGAWIELLNTTTEPLNAGGMNLCEEPGLSTGWQLPDTIIPAKKYLVVYPSAYANTTEPSSPINLSVSGGVLILNNSSGMLIDSVRYGTQVAAKSTGRYPNGYGAMNFMIPSKGGFNSTGTTPGSGFSLYPNPATGLTYVEIRNLSGPVKVNISDMMGQTVIESTYLYGPSQIPSVVQAIDVSGLSSGLHVVRVNCNEVTTSQKLMIY